jgi:hypothetical protein
LVLGRLAALALAALAVAGCTSSGTARTAAPATRTPVPGLVVVHDPGQVTGTLHGPCHDSGQLPDHACTPGSIDITITAARLCAPRYSTRSYRPPESQTQAFKYGQAYPAYGLARSTRTELDHLVSLELGGSNDASNLWPESPPTPNPKDKVENALHAWVCAVSGAASQDRLRKAQLAIAANWTAAEQVLGVPASPSPVTPSPSRSSAPAPVRTTPAPVRTTPAPVRTIHTPAPPATSAAPAAPAACHPLTNGGNCYRAGEYCRNSDHGMTGVAGNGEIIVCSGTGSRWRWEPA